MRLLNLLLVGLCIGGLAVGAFLLGTKVERDANEGLTADGHRRGRGGDRR